MGFLDVYSILVPILTISALLYAGIQDILYREVRREFIWVLMISAGLILDILYLILYDGTRVFTDILSEMLLNIILGFFLGFLLFYIGAWGGADSKALWALSLLVPLHPFLENNPFGFLPENPILFIDSAVISLLLNSGLIALFYPFILLIINAIGSTRGSLFDEVRGSTSEKLRSFFFGYRKKVSKIDPKKIHFDFLEHLPDKEFRGKFIGDYTGRLDGKFSGLFSGKLQGEINGSIVCKQISELSEPFDELDLEEIISTADKFTETHLITKDDDEEDLDYALRKYQFDFNLKASKTEQIPDESILISSGHYSGTLEGIFIGTIDAVFDGAIDGKFIGALTGDYQGESKKGKISGTTKNSSNAWKLVMRMGLDEEHIMERRQLRTLWQLQSKNKETVWVTPGLPFVFLLLLGFILYLFFGNIALYLFRL